MGFLFKSLATKKRDAEERLDGINNQLAERLAKKHRKQDAKKSRYRGRVIEGDFVGRRIL